MGVIRNKMKELDKRINTLNELQDVFINQGSDFKAIINEAQEIVKLASFLDSYKELDKEREKDVKETVMVYLNKNNDYDSAFLKCIGYCFGECD